MYLIPFVCQRKKLFSAGRLCLRTVSSVRNRNCLHVVEIWTVDPPPAPTIYEPRAVGSDRVCAIPGLANLAHERSANLVLFVGSPLPHMNVRWLRESENTSHIDLYVFVFFLRPLPCVRPPCIRDAVGEKPERKRFTMR